MKLAVNYYPETEMLVKDGRIDIDYYKFPALAFQMDILYSGAAAFETFCARLKQTRPILLHGLYPPPVDLSSRSLESELNRTAVDLFLKISSTPGVSVHPCLGAVDPDRTADELSATITGNLRYLVKQYGGMDFVSVENMDSLRYGPLLDAAFIKKIVEDSGASLLLDISHAFCASFYLGEDFYDYLHRLPLERVSEIHINGWAVRDNNIMSHIKIRPEGYRALAHVLNYCKPQLVTVEYGRHNDRLNTGCPIMTPDTINETAMEEICEQVVRVREIIG